MTFRTIPLADSGLVETITSEPVRDREDLVVMRINPDARRIEAESVATVHGRWVQAWESGQRQKHPLAPIVRAHFERPIPVDRKDDRPTSILAAPLIMARKEARLTGKFALRPPV